MCEGVRVCACMCVYTCVYTYSFVRVCACVCVYVHASRCVRGCVCVRVCVYICVYIHILLCVCVWVWVCLCVCTILLCVCARVCVYACRTHLRCVALEGWQNVGCFVRNCWALLLNVGLFCSNIGLFWHTQRTYRDLVARTSHVLHRRDDRM